MPDSTSRIWLALVVLVYLVIAVLFTAQVPAWQAPDEPAHYNYVRELATTGQFPVLRMGDYDEAYLEQLKAQGFPPALSIDPVRYEAHQPPLYYLLQAGVARLSGSLTPSGGGLEVNRLVSVALGALFIWLVYEIARMVFAAGPGLWLGAASFVAYLPMHVAISASVNNDSLAEVLLAVILLASIRYVKLSVVGPVPPTALDALLLGLLVGLALITKVSAYVAVPIALAAPLLAWYDDRSGLPHSSSGSSIQRAAGRLALIALPALALALPWYVRNARLYGNWDILARQWHDSVVVGQLRTTELLVLSGVGAVLERFTVWSFNSFWGVFGWMGVWMDGRIYTALLAWSLAVTMGCLSLLVRRRSRSERQLQKLTDGSNTAKLAAKDPSRRFQLLALGLLALSALLTLGIYVSYNLIFVQPQGRYLFPALPAIAVAAALGWREVVRVDATARLAAGALLLAGLAAVGWGLITGGINKWSLTIFLAAAAVLLAWSVARTRMRPALGQRLAVIAYALPFAGLAALDVLALQAFILPQLG